MDFEWGIKKNDENKRKHSVSFEEAMEMWNDFNVEIEEIAYSDDEEKRNATIGWVKGRVYLAIWTLRNRKRRLISVRRARKNEEKFFAKKIQDERTNG